MENICKIKTKVAFSSVKFPLHHTAGLPLCNEAMLQVMHGSYGPGTKPPHHLIGLAALLFALCTSLKFSALLCMAVNTQGLQNFGWEQNIALFK